MALTSKQRAQLRGMAASLETIIFVGKSGVTDTLAEQVDQNLTAHELIKGRVQENSPLTPREACDELAARCSAEGVQVIGSKFVLYRRNQKEPKIVLVKAGKK